MADGAYHAGKFEDAVRTYRKISNRRYEQQKGLLASLANLGRYVELQNEVKQYVSNAPQQKAGIITFIEKNSQFASFRNQPDYQTFISSLRSGQ